MSTSRERKKGFYNTMHSPDTIFTVNINAGQERADAESEIHNTQCKNGDSGQ